MYSPIVMEHFANPRNTGAMDDATVSGCAGAPGQGSFMVVHLRVEGCLVVKARFQTLGCPAMIACGSLLTEWVAGKTLSEATAITVEELSAGLGGLPLGREHCAALAIKALRDAIACQSDCSPRAMHPPGA